MTTGDEQSRIEQALTDEVVASFAGAPERLREVMQSLTRHLHAFIREVRLTEDEWRAAIDFLTAVGKITDDKRQEFILDRKSTRLNSSHVKISYAVFCL